MEKLEMEFQKSQAQNTKLIQENLKTAIANSSQQPRSKKRILASLILSSALSICSISSAHAFFDIGGVVKVAKDTFNGVTQNVDNTANQVGGTIENTTITVIDSVTQYGDDVVNEGVSQVQTGLEQSKQAMEGFVTAGYQQAAEALFQQLQDPMTKMVDAWKLVIASEPAKYYRLTNALINRDGPEINAALQDVLRSLMSYTAFNSVIDNFQENNAGSFVLIVSGGVGAGGIAGGVDIGLAIDVDYLRYWADQILAGNGSSYDGAIASLFLASGVQVGPAAGGGVDFVIGYHTADPEGVSGPGMDISLEVKAKVGGSFGVSYDLTTFPPQIVMAGIGVGAGAEFQASVGPSYTFVLGALCANGTLEALGNSCTSALSWNVVEGGLKNISAGHRGDVCGTNSYDQIFCYAGNNSWVQIPGGLRTISVGSYGIIWGTNAIGQVWRYSGTWHQIPAPVKMKDISIGPNGDVWSVSFDGDIYNFNYTTWEQIPGKLKNISVGPFGYGIWGTNDSDQIWNYDTVKKVWTLIPGKLKNISVGKNGDILGTNQDNIIWRYNKDYTWSMVPGKLNTISVGPNGELWGTSAEGKIFTNQ